MSKESEVLFNGAAGWSPAKERKSFGDVFAFNNLKKVGTGTWSVTTGFLAIRGLQVWRAKLDPYFQEGHIKSEIIENIKATKVAI